MIPYPQPQRNLADQGSGPGQGDGGDANQPSAAAGGAPTTHSYPLREGAGEELADWPPEITDDAAKGLDIRSKAHALSCDHARPPTERPPPGRRVSWRSLGAAGLSVGTPAALGMLHPTFGEAAAGAEILVATTVIATALFGSKALSDRAFRLLRWFGNRPEPPGPDDINSDHR
jgi:hypothetical protein